MSALPAGARILLVLADLVGDTLFRTPALHLLSRHLPKLRFDAVTFSASAASLLRYDRAVQQVHVRHRPETLAELAGGYDLLIHLGRTKLDRHVRDLPVPALRYRKGPRDRHKAEDLLQYAAALLPKGTPVTEDDRRYHLEVGPRERRRVAELLRAHGIDPGRDRLVGLHPGCSATAAHPVVFGLQRLVSHPKAWPLARHVELARHLTASRPGVRCIAVGSAPERLLTRRLARSVRGTVDLAGRLDLIELAALMDHLRVLVCHDTGPLHVACARGTPLVALLGPTRPERTGPYPLQPRFTVLRGESGERTRDIPVAEVARAVLRKLDAPGAARPRERTGWPPRTTVRPAPTTPRLTPRA